jgi:hypothetical protein
MTCHNCADPKSTVLTNNCARCIGRWLASLHDRRSAIFTAEVMEIDYPFTAGEMLAAMDAYNAERMPA